MLKSYILFLKFFSKLADIKFVIRQMEIQLMKKITTPSHNRCESVELILRGAKKRRVMAYATAASVNSDAGIKANLRAIK